MIRWLRIVLFSFFLGLTSWVSLWAAADIPTVILDTDISSDVDDVGAVAVLHGLASRGEVKILAMMVSSGDPWSAPCLEALNTWYGRAEIPVGMVERRAVRHVSKYTQAIATEFGQGVPVDAATPGAVELYRKTLAAQPDESVTLISVGYLTNLRNLLLSQPDRHSPLHGIALVKSKVQRLVCMGGQYPRGREWNFYQDTPATQLVIEHWPTPLVFCGFEIGRSVLTGSGLRQANPEAPLARAYQLYNRKSNRPSWDQVTVLLGLDAEVRKKLFGQDFFSFVSEGGNRVMADGTNFWEPLRGRKQSYVTLEVPPEVLATQVETLMIGDNLGITKGKL